MINIVFFATPEITLNSLEFLAQQPDINVLAVVTKIDKPQGRGHKLMPPPVKVCAQKYNIPVYQPKLLRNDVELLAKLKAFNPDFFVTFAYGQILSQEVLDIPKFATINLHASLLPKYRGANPIQCCLLNGDKETGITTMLTVLELDAGDICECKKIDISPDMNCEELVNKISQESPSLIYSTLKGLYNNTLIPKAQSQDGVSFANKFDKQQACINWEDTAEKIHNVVRACMASCCAYTFFNGKNIKIISSKKLAKENTVYSPATLVAINKQGLEIQTSDGILLVEKVKPEGKGIMFAKDWINGAKMQLFDKFNCSLTE